MGSIYSSPKNEPIEAWEQDFRDFYFETGKYEHRKLGFEEYVAFFRAKLDEARKEETRSAKKDCNKPDFIQELEKLKQELRYFVTNLPVSSTSVDEVADKVFHLGQHSEREVATAYKNPTISTEIG